LDEPGFYFPFPGFRKTAPHLVLFLRYLEEGANIKGSKGITMGEKAKGNGKRILIIDNDPGIPEYLKEETRKIGLVCCFDEAASFPQAVESIFSGGYDLVLLDFPGIRGPYLLNLALLRKIPVVVLASSGMFPLEASHLLEKGIQEIIPRENLEDVVSVLASFFSSPSPV
jgi:CheY-like chemotaxis protein